MSSAVPASDPQPSNVSKAKAHLKKHKKKYIVGGSVAAAVVAVIVIKKQIPPLLPVTVGQSDAIKLLVRSNNVKSYNDVVANGLRSGVSVTLDDGKEVIVGVLCGGKDMKGYNKVVNLITKQGGRPGLETKDFLVPYVSEEQRRHIAEAYNKLTRPPTLKG